jgi:lactoylglutathione lyase
MPRIEHVALWTQDIARLRDFYAQHFGAAGHPVLDGPRRTGDGYYESVVLDPDGNRIEITV